MARRGTSPRRTPTGFSVGIAACDMNRARGDDIPTTSAAGRGTNLRGGSPVRSLYHLPANADVRAHLLISATACGWLTAELALIAVYYNFRWVARYVLIARRIRAAAAP